MTQPTEESTMRDQQQHDDNRRRLIEACDTDRVDSAATLRARLERASRPAARVTALAD